MNLGLQTYPEFNTLSVWLYSLIAFLLYASFLRLGDYVHRDEPWLGSQYETLKGFHQVMAVIMNHLDALKRKHFSTIKLEHVVT